MERDDRQALTALGFEETELRALALWEAATGSPEELAEMYVRRSKKKEHSDVPASAGARNVCAGRERRRCHPLCVVRTTLSEQGARPPRRVEAGNPRCILDGLSKTLYVYKNSRLSRRGMGQVGLLLDEFDKRHARIFFTVERIDSSKGSRMIIAILSEQAREQAADIAQFTKLGIDANKNEGVWAGGVCPYGLESPRGQRKADAPTGRIPDSAQSDR